ncbi:MAG TPA: hypothetical protein VF288_10945 [Mycobacteriales bacterium]
MSKWPAVAKRAPYRRMVVAVVSVCAVAGLTVPAFARASGGVSSPSTYLVGAAQRSINPTPQMLAGHDFYLGGYGVTDGKVAGTVAIPGETGRLATGILGDGIHVRALAVSDGRHTLELAEIETQGYFAAYRAGPYGIEDIRKDAAAQISALAAHRSGARGPALDAGSILVDSDHSHGGPDTVGVWGGVPTSYLQLVHDRTVAALVAAYEQMRPATLSYGMAHAGVVGEAARYPSPDPLLTNQFSNDPNNQVVDDQLRVLQARDRRTGNVIVTYVNFSGHPTVLDADNTLVTGDYPQVLDAMLAQAYGGIGFDQVATLGRTQPNRGSCAPATPDGGAQLACLSAYAGRVLARARQALAAAQPLTGPPVVAMNSYLVEDPGTGPALLALLYAGGAIGAPVERSLASPWITGNVVGTTTFSGRIGDLLLSGGPGEMWPQITAEVQADVPARGYLNIGTAGDFLGYFIYPLSAYPEPIRRTVLSGNPPPSGDTCSGIHSPVGCPSPLDNDTFSFNLSTTIGARVTCSLLRGAGDVFAHDPSRFRSLEPACALFPADLLRPAGADTTAG